MSLLSPLPRVPPQGPPPPGEEETILPESRQESSRLASQPAFTHCVWRSHPPPHKDLRAASELSRQQPREAPHDRDTAGTHQGSPGALPRLPGSSLQAPSAFTVANSGCSPFHGPQASGSKHSAHTNSLSPQNHLHYITLIYRDGNSLAQGHTASKR